MSFIQKKFSIEQNSRRHQSKRSAYLGIKKPRFLKILKLTQWPHDFS